MTAEVAILNRSAIVLAADSAVTVESPNGEKTYHSVNKLFTLSKYHPIGIMIYGNADFMNFPWETLIKVYRNALVDKLFRTVSEATDDFIKHLETGRSFTPDQQLQRLERIWSVYFESLLDAIRNKLIQEAATRRKQLGTPDVQALTEQVLIPIVARLRQSESLPSMASIAPKDFIKKHQKLLNRVRDRVFSGRPLSARAKRLLREFAGLVIVKNEMSPLSSGIVIAGFGEEEMFPRLVSISTDGFVDGLHRIRRDQYVVIGPEIENRANIQAFAQHEMVMRFMEGVDPSYQRYMDEGVERLLYDIVGRVIGETVPDEGEKKAQALNMAHRAASKALREFRTKAIDFRQGVFAGPIVSTVAVLPKEELANLAESLVNLTSIKHRMSMETETVGGPIDVAIISKGDGFIWLKRKHYFRPELNPSFDKLYLR